MLFAQTGKDNQGQRETECRGKGVDHALQQVEVFLNHEDGHTEHSAVGRDERQEDAQSLIEAGAHLLQDDFHHLHQCGYHEDKGQRLEVREAEGVEHVGLHEPCHDGGQCQHEGHSSTHAHRGVHFFGDTEERTDSEKLAQNDVVDENGRNKYQ